MENINNEGRSTKDIIKELKLKAELEYKLNANNQQQNSKIDYNLMFDVIIEFIKQNVEKQGIRKYYMDHNLRQYYRLLCQYFTANPKFEQNFITVLKDGREYKIFYKLKKGLLVIGKPGISKSFSFEKVIHNFNHKYFNFFKNAYKIERSTTIKNNFENMGGEALDFYQKQKCNLYIDDLCKEGSTVKKYANEYKPLRDVLNIRHQMFVDFGYKTYATSNFMFKEIVHYYSDNNGIDIERMSSRFYEMFNIIVLDNDINLREDYVL